MVMLFWIDYTPLPFSKFLFENTTRQVILFFFREIKLRVEFDARVILISDSKKRISKVHPVWDHDTQLIRR